MVEVFENYNIKNDSTFKIGGIVKKVVIPDSVDELVELLKSQEYDMVLGNCSNVLFSSGKINKNIILTKNINSYRLDDNRVYVQCGTLGSVVSKEAADKGLTGFEFLIGFPGSFGGMIYMNASAHNQSIADTFASARVFDCSSLDVINYDKEQMKFEYRKSCLNLKKCVLLDAVFELKQGNKEEILEIMKRNTDFRKERQPSLKFGNAGSVFKNPQNDSAGRLLDLCNLKGMQEGGAKVFENHANFIINYNNATSEDVLTLMYKMYSAVREKYRIKLEPEIKYIGDEDTKEYKLWQIMTENIPQMLK
ncbi:UDP-N-acetylmuramate dehydrogenase [bacterium]|nr:UDP-N-acetylmuramate dehydrogenase [bacterium]